MREHVESSPAMSRRAELEFRLKIRKRMRFDLLQQLAENKRDIAEAKQLLREADDLMRPGVREKRDPKSQMKGRNNNDRRDTRQEDGERRPQLQDDR